MDDWHWIIKGNIADFGKRDSSNQASPAKGMGAPAIAGMKAGGSWIYLGKPFHRGPAEPAEFEQAE